MRQILKLVIITLSLLVSIGLVGQQTPNDILSVELFSSQNGAAPGENLDVALVVDIHHPWHVYAPIGNDDFTIPITPSITAEGKPFTVADWEYPDAQMIAVAGVNEPAAVYGDRIILRTTLAINSNATESLLIQGEVYFQACDDTQCLIPETVNFELVVPFLATGELASQTHAEFFTKAAGQIQSEEPQITNTDDESDDISDKVEKYGMILTFAIIFIGGLGLNLTPCVYPLIPITISFFGGIEASKGKTFWMALAYVLGIAVTYSVLGVAAALGGGLFGALLTNPFVLIGIAALLVGLSLSMFGVYEFRLPTGLMTAASQSKAGIFGSFFMGLTLGIVAAPCVGPFVIGLLTYVAAQQDVLLGFTMFFTLAMGLGLPYLFLAMYSNKLASMPRSGSWMIGVRVIFGFVLIAMAIYFVMPLMGAFANPVMSIFLIGAGSYLIMFENSSVGNVVFNRSKQAIAIILIVIGTWMGIPEPEVTSGGIDWAHPTTQEQLDDLLVGSKPVMIDVFADWCIPCKEMDKFTFPNADVVQLSQEFTAIKIDMTKQNGEFEQSLLEQFSIKGVPTYIFIKDGKELKSLRSTGFEGAEDFLNRMKGAL